MDNLLENNSLLNFSGTIGRKQYFINFGLLMLGFTVIGLLFVTGLILDKQIEPQLRPSNISFLLYVISFIFAIPLLIMSWINKFKRIRDIRGTQQKEKTWFAIWILLGLIPYSGLIISITLGLIQSKNKH